MTFDEFWKLNSKRIHSENPWREELAREIWEAAQNNTWPSNEINEVKRDKINQQTSQNLLQKEKSVPEGDG